MNPTQLRAWQALEIGPQFVARRHAEVAEVLAPGATTEASPAPAESQAPEPEGFVTGGPSNDDTQSLAGSLDQSNWAQLSEMISTCRQCELSASRTQAVVGGGASSPRWLVVLGVPGRAEDETGSAVAAENAFLLDGMLTAMGGSRQKNVFVLSAVKCRPTDDQTPGAVQVQACRPYLLRQIALLAPDLILTAGPLATQAVLGREVSDAKADPANTDLEALRGTVHSARIAEQDLPVVVTCELAYLLDNPIAKRKAWQDLCLAESIVALHPERLAK